MISALAPTAPRVLSGSGYSYISGETFTQCIAMGDLTLVLGACCCVSYLHLRLCLRGCFCVYLEGSPPPTYHP